MYLFYLQTRLSRLPTRNWIALANADNTDYIKVIFNYQHRTISVYRNTNLVGETEHNFPTQANSTVFLKIKATPETLTLSVNRTQIVLHAAKLNITRFYRSYWLNVTAFQESNHIPITVTVCDSINGLEQSNAGLDDFSIDSETEPTPSVDSVSDAEVDTDADDDSEHIRGMSDGTVASEQSGQKSISVGSKTSSEQIEAAISQLVVPDTEVVTPTPTPTYVDNLGPVPDMLSKSELNRPIKLSFCLTCLKRYSQITKTLPINLRDNIHQSHLIEFVVVDFGTPGLYEYIYHNFQEHLQTGYLRYVRTDRLRSWHASVAKNTAHRLSRGKILVNLDGDNFTGWRGAEHILRIFNKYGPNTMFHQWSGVSKDGTYGRISMSRQNFFRLGGYDESFFPMGYQDHDIIMRYHGLGVGKYLSYDTLTPQQQHRYRNRFSRAIENDKTKSLANTKFTGKMDWTTMNSLNKHKSHQNIMSGKFQVNRNLEYLGVYIKL